MKPARSSPNPGNLLEPPINLQPQALPNPHHLIRTRGSSTHTQHSITLLLQSHRDRMKHLVERLVPNPPRSCKRHQGQCEPLPKHRNMPRPKNRQRVRLHQLHVLLNQFRIIASTRPVRPRNQNHHRLPRICFHRPLFRVYDSHDSANRFYFFFRRGISSPALVFSPPRRFISF